jgi:integrase
LNAVAACPADRQRSQAAIEWAEIAAAAPQLADTMRRYLRQAATFLAPASVDSADGALRIFARWLLANTPVLAVADVSRDAIEDFKVYLAGRPGMRGAALSENTQRQRLRTLRVFFERIIEWDWADTPPRNPILNWDLPKRPEPLPRFLDDAQAAKVMAAARSSTDPRDRLIVELLARTGMRAGELTALDADAMVRIGAGHWLRIPIGKRPQRPLCAAAPAAGRSAHRLDRDEPRPHPRTSAPGRRSPRPAQPLHRRTHRRPGRPRRRR